MFWLHILIILYGLNLKSVSGQNSEVDFVYEITTQEEYRGNMKRRRPPSLSKTHIFEALQVILLGSLVVLQLQSSQSLENLPTFDQVTQIISSLSGISTQLTALSLSLNAVLTPLAAILGGLTAALGGINTFVTLIVNFVRGIFGLLPLPRNSQVMENVLKMMADHFPRTDATQKILDKVVHGFDLEDVQPSLPKVSKKVTEDVKVETENEKKTTDTLLWVDSKKDRVKDTLLWVNSKKDQVNFYQYEFKKKQVP